MLDGWSRGTRQPDPSVAEAAASVLLAGGLVGLPTETVYGLAADAQDARAVARIFLAKGRPIHHPLIVHVAGPQALSAWAAGRNELAERLAGALWPGPLTLVVRRSARAGDWVTGGQTTVALRCPDHPIALACIEALASRSGDRARGVAAPSANRFGAVSPTSAADVIAELADWLDPSRDIVVDGGPAAVGVESTIVDCTGPMLRILRPGAIGGSQLYEVLAESGVRPSGGLFRPDQVGWSGRATQGASPIVEDGPSTRWGETAGPSAGAAGHAGLRSSEGAGPTEAVRSHESGEPDRTDEVRAPGMLASHYAPEARVLLVADPTTVQTRTAGLRVGLLAPQGIPTPFGWVRLAAPDSDAAYARQLYAALRAADLLRLDCVVAVPPDPDDGALAVAVKDRLRRAAQEVRLSPGKNP